MKFIAADSMDTSIDFEQLMQQGRLAYDRGNKGLAHDLWREAALLNPYNEQVWLALLDVLDSPEDQQVCLQNILEINPLNVQARRMLRSYEIQEERRNELEEERSQRFSFLRQRRRKLMIRALLLGVILGLSGLFFAVVLSIMIYST